MGFRSGVPVVGLRTYFFFAISLGLFIGLVGLYGIYRSSGDTIQTEDGDPRPNIVVLGINHLPHDFELSDSPELAGLFSLSLRAYNAFGTVDLGAIRSMQDDLQAVGYSAAEWSPGSPAGSLRDAMRSLQPPFMLTMICSEYATMSACARELHELLRAQNHTRGVAILATHLFDESTGTDLPTPQRRRIPLLLTYMAALPVAVEMDEPVWAEDVLQTIRHLSGLETPAASPLAPSSLLAMRIANQYHTIAVVRDGDRVCGGLASEWVCADTDGSSTSALLPADVSEPSNDDEDRRIVRVEEELLKVLPAFDR